MKRDKTGPGTTPAPAGQAERRGPAPGRSAKRAERDLKECRELGERLEQVARRSREILYLATVYRLLHQAFAERSYGDTLRTACGRGAGLGGEHLAVDLIRHTYHGELPPETEREWVGALSYARSRGCTPDEVAGFLKEHGVANCYREFVELTRSRSLPATTDTTSATEGDGKTGADETPTGTRQGKETASAPPVPTGDEPPPANDGGLPVTVVLTGDAVRTYRKLVAKGSRRKLRARLWFDGTTLFGRELWRPSPKPPTPSPRPAASRR